MKAKPINYDVIRQKMLDKITNKQMTASEAARQIGISDATISHIINETYRDKAALMPSDKMWLKISKWSGVQSGWVTAETANYKRVHNICRHAQDNGISRAISFDPGTGKTYALKAYAHEMPNSFYVECDEFFTRKVFLREIMRSLGIANGQTSISEMVADIVHRLNTTDRPLLIIDEADKLNDSSLNLYKTLYNRCQAGFVLTGTPYFRIKIDKGVSRNRMGYCEVFSRIGGEFIPLHKVDDKMVRQVCQVNGVTDEKEIMEVCAIANGDLRRVNAMVNRIRLRAITE